MFAYSPIPLHAGCNMGYGAGKSLAVGSIFGWLTVLVPSQCVIKSCSGVCLLAALTRTDSDCSSMLSTPFVQMWKQYIPNAKVSYLEYDAPCATKHKTDIEAQAGGTLYIGKQCTLSEPAFTSAIGFSSALSRFFGYPLTSVVLSASYLASRYDCNGLQRIDRLSKCGYHCPIITPQYLQSKFGFLTGDQADQKLLDKILADSKSFGGYDVIIDDGGHTVNQMLTSIKVMLPLTRLFLPCVIFLASATSHSAL